MKYKKLFVGLLFVFTFIAMNKGEAASIVYVDTWGGMPPLNWGWGYARIGGGHGEPEEKSRGGSSAPRSDGFVENPSKADKDDVTYETVLATIEALKIQIAHKLFLDLHTAIRLFCSTTYMLTAKFSMRIVLTYF